MKRFKNDNLTQQLKNDEYRPIPKGYHKQKRVHFRYSIVYNINIALFEQFFLEQCK